VFYGLTGNDLPVRWAGWAAAAYTGISRTERSPPARAPQRQRARVLLKFQGGDSGVLAA